MINRIKYVSFTVAYILTNTKSRIKMLKHHLTMRDVQYIKAKRFSHPLYCYILFWL